MIQPERLRDKPGDDDIGRRGRPTRRGTWTPATSDGGRREEPAVATAAQADVRIAADRELAAHEPGEPFRERVDRVLVRRRVSRAEDVVERDRSVDSRGIPGPHHDPLAGTEAACSGKQAARAHHVAKRHAESRAVQVELCRAAHELRAAVAPGCRRHNHRDRRSTRGSDPSRPRS